MKEILVQLALTPIGYLLCGVIVIATYAIVWGAREQRIHAYCWPIVLGHMFWVKPLPPWLKPAPRSLRGRTKLW